MCATTMEMRSANSTSSCFHTKRIFFFIFFHIYLTPPLILLCLLCSLCSEDLEAWEVQAHAFAAPADTSSSSSSSASAGSNGVNDDDDDDDDDKNDDDKEEEDLPDAAPSSDSTAGPPPPKRRHRRSRMPPRPGVGGDSHKRIMQDVDAQSERQPMAIVVDNRGGWGDQKETGMATATTTTTTTTTTTMTVLGRRRMTTLSRPRRPRRRGKSYQEGGGGGGSGETKVAAAVLMRRTSRSITGTRSDQAATTPPPPPPPPLRPPAALVLIAAVAEYKQHASYGPCFAYNLAQSRRCAQRSDSLILYKFRNLSELHPDAIRYPRARARKRTHTPPITRNKEAMNHDIERRGQAKGEGKETPHERDRRFPFVSSSCILAYFALLQQDGRKGEG